MKRLRLKLCKIQGHLTMHYVGFLGRAVPCRRLSLCKKNTIRQVTTMLATSKKSYLQVIATMITTGTDDPSRADARVIIKSVRSSVPVVSRWL